MCLILAGDARNFQEKKRHFQTELRRLNPQIESDDQVDINVNRSNLLESVSKIDQIHFMTFP